MNRILAFAIFSVIGILSACGQSKPSAATVRNDIGKIVNSSKMWQSNQNEISTRNTPNVFKLNTVNITGISVEGPHALVKATINVTYVGATYYACRGDGVTDLKYGDSYGWGCTSGAKASGNFNLQYKLYDTGWRLENVERDLSASK